MFKNQTQASIESNEKPNEDLDSDALVPLPVESMDSFKTLQSNSQLQTGVSPLQMRAKKILRKTRKELGVADPNGGLRNAPEGIVAHRVRQSLEYRESQKTYDYEKEK